MQAVVESLVGAGLADEDGVEALAEGQLADGMAAAQVVGDQDGAEDAGLAAMLLDPALGTIALALLLAALVGESGVAGGGVLSVPNELGQAGEDPTCADRGGTDCGAEALGRPDGPDLACRAPVAMHVPGALEPGTDESDSGKLAGDGEVLERVAVVEGIEGADEGASKAAGSAPWAKARMVLSERLTPVAPLPPRTLPCHILATRSRI